MNSSAPVPVISPDAGNPAILANPNSLEAIMKKTTEQKVQSEADTLYDAPAPPPQEGFQVRTRIETGRHSAQIHSLFLTMGILLLAYSLFPE
jgi:hypothetical protein